MPRLRQPVTVKKDEPFDSTKVKPPVEEDLKEPQLEAVAEDEPEVVIEEPKQDEPKQADAALALKKQVDALRQSEDLLKREREAAIKAASENREKFVKSQRDILEAQEIALDKTKSAAKSDAEKALLDYKNALDTGDNAAAAEAMDRLTDAKTSMRAFERDIEELKIRKKELKKERRKLEEQPEQQAQPETVEAYIDRLALPSTEKQWLRDHQDYITDQVKAGELGLAHARATKAGLKPGDARYLPEINRILEAIGSLDNEEPAQTSRKTSIVSAPVSREIPSGGTGQRQTPSKITLTREQLDAAKIAGVSPAEYARQLIKFNELKANGEYGERR